MRSLRGRFILSHMLPVLLVVPLVALALILTIESQVLLADVGDDLEERAGLIAEILESQPAVWREPELATAIIDELAPLFDGGLVLLTANGQILAVASAGGGSQLLANVRVDALQPGESLTSYRYGLFNHEAVFLAPVTSLEQELLGVIAVSESVYGAASAFGMLRQLVIGIVLLELAIGLIIAVWLAGRLARPIAAAARGVVDIAAGRPFSEQTPSGPDEIRALSLAVNDLAERLRLLEEARRRSLANIVHEIGRPLGAVRSATHVLRGVSGEDPELREELLSGIDEEIRRLQPLLDDLSLLHGQVLGQLELHRRPVAFADWLVSALLPWRAAALEKELQWETTIPSDLPEVALDPERMAQVVGNLLSNAIKYTPAPGKVKVVARSTEQAVSFTVSDSGPGILESEREAIFEPFFRSEAERRFPQGLGLGLTIARDLVEAHGGRLTLESTPGAGSAFVVVLPLPPTAA